MTEEDKEQARTLLRDTMIAMEDVADLEKTLSRLHNEGEELIKKLQGKLK